MHEKACVDFKGKYRQQKKDINVRTLTNHELNYNKIRSLKTSHKYLTRSTIIAIAPRRLPRRAPAKKQKNVCNVIGTPPICKKGAQAVIFVPILMKATNIPINVRSKIRRGFFVFNDLLPLCSLI